MYEPEVAGVNMPAFRAKPTLQFLHFYYTKVSAIVILHKFYIGRGMLTRNMLRLAVLLACCTAPVSAWAKDDAQLWTNTSAKVKLGDGWSISQELTARFSDNRNGLYELESDTLLNYQISPMIMIGAGYVHDPNYAGGDFTVMEHRAREEVTFNNLIHIGPGAISARMRLETRWRDGATGTGWRLRPYVKYSLPLGSHGIKFSISHESFVNLNSVPYQKITGENRMRNMAALSFPVSKVAGLEVGYIEQHGFVPGGADSDDHVASVALKLSL